MGFSLTPVVGDNLVGRKAILSELAKELSSKNRIGISLSGIRRIGKTSILKEVGQQLRDQNILVIYVSVWRVSPDTVDEFIRVLNRATLSAFEHKLPAKFKFEQLLATGAKALGLFLQSLKLSAKVSEDLELSISYVRRESNDVDAAVTKAFALVEDLAEMTKTQCILMIDEFPSVVDLTYGSKNQKIGDSIVKLLRTLYEEFKFTKLVISGSYRDTLENLVTKQKAPFYKQLLIRQVNPFSEAEFNEFLNHYLPGVKLLDRAKQELYRVSSGIPYNLQLLGKEIQGLKVVDLQGLNAAIEEILQKEGELAFKEFIESLTPSEVKVLKAMAKSPGIKPSDLATQEFMDDNTVNTSLNLLVKKGMLRRRARGLYEFTDNMFAEWLRRSDSINL